MYLSQPSTHWLSESKIHVPIQTKSNIRHKQQSVSMSFIKGVILSEPHFKVFVFSFLVLIIAYA